MISLKLVADRPMMRRRSESVFGLKPLKHWALSSTILRIKITTTVAFQHHQQQQQLRIPPVDIAMLNRTTIHHLHQRADLNGIQKSRSCPPPSRPLARSGRIPLALVEVVHDEQAQPQYQYFHVHIPPTSPPFLRNLHPSSNTTHLPHCVSSH